MQTGSAHVYCTIVDPILYIYIYIILYVCSTYHLPVALRRVDIYICICIYSFLTSASRSTSLSEALPTTAMTLFRSLHAEALQATAMKDLLKVPTWRLERDSNPRPTDQKASTLRVRHHAPQIYVGLYFRKIE